MRSPNPIGAVGCALGLALAGHVPMARIHTVITPMDYPLVTPESAARMLKHMASEHHIAQSVSKTLTTSKESATASGRKALKPKVAWSVARTWWSSRRTWAT